MNRVAFFDAKPYDHEFFGGENSREFVWDFHSFPLSAAAAGVIENAFAVCVFVHDVLDEACLAILREKGVRLAVLRCAGFNFVDLEAAARLGIRVTRVPEYSPSAVAEHSVAMLLALNRKLHRAYLRMREHNFSLNGLLGFDLCGKTVGILGCGRIGKKAAQIFRGFDTRVLAFDPFPDTDWAREKGVVFTDQETLLREADIISLHLPLTPETRYLINRDSIRQMKRGVYLVNTSRGGLVDTGALIEGLKSGHIGGVALDVYEEEEGIYFEDKSLEILDDEMLAYLLTFPNVLATAHQAFFTREALLEIARVTKENLAAHLHNAPFLPGTELRNERHD